MLIVECDVPDCKTTHIGNQTVYRFISKKDVPERKLKVGEYWAYTNLKNGREDKRDYYMCEDHEFKYVKKAGDTSIVDNDFAYVKVPNFKQKNMNLKEVSINV